MLESRFITLHRGGQRLRANLHGELCLALNPDPLMDGLSTLVNCHHASPSLLHDLVSTYKIRTYHWLRMFQRRQKILGVWVFKMYITLSFLNWLCEKQPFKSLQVGKAAILLLGERLLFLSSLWLHGAGWQWTHLPATGHIRGRTGTCNQSCHLTWLSLGWHRSQGVCTHGCQRTAGSVTSLSPSSHLKSKQGNWWRWNSRQSRRGKARGHRCLCRLGNS